MKVEQRKIRPNRPGATGLRKSTVVRLMKSLCAMGYAANDRRQGGYTVARVKSLSNGHCNTAIHR